MRERLAAGARKPEDAHLEESALRRQLEGGVEELEAALERYRHLTSALGARRWKQRLQQQPTLLSDAVAGESALAEVLPRIQRRAERESQSAEFASQLLRRVEEERTRLTTAMNRRLRPAAPGTTLAERLGQLSAVALRPLPRPPGPGELRLLEGHAWLPPAESLLLFLPLWWILASFLGVGITLPLLVAFWLAFYARSGSYWLTSERLIWQPRWSDPVEVRLSDIGEGHLRVGAFNTVTVGAQDGVPLLHVSDATRLAALLSIRRRKEFREAAASRDPRRLVALLRMGPVAPGQRLEPGDSYRWGSAVLRPGFIVYFGNGGARLLDTITEPTGPTRGYSWLSRDEVPIPVELLLEQLLLLPEERMDAMLRKAVTVETPSFSSRPDVFLWEARALTWKLRAYGSLKVYQGDKALFGYLSWSDTPLVEQLVAQWKALQETQPGEPDVPAALRR